MPTTMTAAPRASTDNVIAATSQFDVLPREAALLHALDDPLHEQAGSVPGQPPGNPSRARRDDQRVVALQAAQDVLGEQVGLVQLADPLGELLGVEGGVGLRQVGVDAA